MFEFKRLDRFMLKTFLPLFAMTFLICTFLVLMQFLWMHLTDLVGKGLGMGLLLELFFYAALSMVPMALPLAVLLASLHNRIIKIGEAVLFFSIPFWTPKRN